MTTQATKYLKNGEPCWVRTSDLLIKSQVGALFLLCFFVNTCGSAAFRYKDLRESVNRARRNLPC